MIVRTPQYLWGVLCLVPMRFIKPSVPVDRTALPTGGDWLHEVKQDGYRLQLHKSGKIAHVLSRSGFDCSKKFKAIHEALGTLACRSCIIDAGGVSVDELGRSDFAVLMAGKRDTCCAWCFDLMELNGKDVRPLPLVERRRRLEALLRKSPHPLLRYSQDFGDGTKLLAVAEEMALEGIVSKKRNQPYRSGRNSGCVKVKTAAWRKLNRGRAKLFNAPK